MDWIIVVDDDLYSLEEAKNILVENGMRVDALRSGQEMLDYISANGAPDLILLNITMPDMNGLEALKKLRELEKGKKETPVIFLAGTHDLSREVEGLQLGAMDYLQKPFVPEVLLERVQRVLRTQGRMNRLEQAAAIDKMTGMLNKDAAEEKMRELCESETGFLCMLDLDSFKLVNDLYGHEMGDRVLVLFADILQRQMRHDDACGRIGGDEFILFLRNMKLESELKQFIARISEVYLTEVGELLGKQIPLGVSVGAVSIPEHGRNYEELFREADDALYSVKQNGRHGLNIATGRVAARESAPGEMTLSTITTIMEERTAPSSAMWMGREAFTSIYQYMLRYMERYHGVAYRTLFTIHMNSNDCGDEERAKIMTQFRKTMQRSLRYSDVMVEISDNQLFLLLPETKDYNIEQVIHRLLDRWDKSGYGNKVTVSYETGRVRLHREGGPDKERGRDQVVIVDDDEITLKIASFVLSRQDMHVTCLTSGIQLMDELAKGRPDLILLDVNMPDMSGFETYERMRKASMSYGDIPVIFLSEEDSREEQILGMKLGAADFVRKPFVAEVLAMRVKNSIELSRLQYHLSQEVARKTAENNQAYLSMILEKLEKEKGIRLEPEFTGILRALTEDLPE